MQNHFRLGCDRHL